MSVLRQDGQVQEHAQPAHSARAHKRRPGAHVRSVWQEVQAKGGPQGARARSSHRGSAANRDSVQAVRQEIQANVTGKSLFS